MKKPKWKIVCGILLLFTAFGTVSPLLSPPTESIPEIIGQIITTFCYIVLAIYLFVTYFKTKDKIDSGQTEVEPTPNSPEDIEKLRNKRNKIIASVFLLEIIGSLTTWITNNYLAGPTIENIRTIIDIIFNIGFVYFIFSLYKSKPVLNQLFYWMIIATVGYVAIDTWDQLWFYVAADIIFGAYFIYYIKSSVNRRNYRIANFIILPLLLIATIGQAFSSSSNISNLTNQELSAEADFADSHLNLISKYNELNQETNVDKYPEEAIALAEALKNKEEKTKNLETVLENLKQEVDKNEVNGNQDELQAKIDKLSRLLQLHKIFDSRVKELVIFVQTLSPDNMTEEDFDKFLFLDKQVLIAQKDIQDASKEYIDTVIK